MHTTQPDYLGDQEMNSEHEMSMDETDFEAALENYLHSDFGELEDGSIITGTVVKIGTNTSWWM